MNDKTNTCKFHIMNMVLEKKMKYVCLCVCVCTEKNYGNHNENEKKNSHEFRITKIFSGQERKKRFIHYIYVLSFQEYEK